MKAGEAFKLELSWGFLSSLGTVAIVVVAITNTIGALRPTLSRRAIAFVAAEILAFYAAWLHDQLTGTWPWFHAAFQGFLIFCIAMGGNQSVLAVAGRLRGQGAGTAQRGWWTAW